MDYVNNRDFAYAPYEDDDDGEDLNATALPLAKDLGPEGMVFVDSVDSPTGNPLLIVSNESLLELPQFTQSVFQYLSCQSKTW